MNDDQFLANILEIPEETQVIEFKRLNSRNQVEKIVETIIAMSNTDGGTIVIGIDDPEKTSLKGENRVFGIEENPDAYDAIGREIQKIIPPLVGLWPSIILKSNSGKSVAIINVPKSTQNFYSYNKHVFVRAQKSNKLLSPQEIIKFSYAKGFDKADKELVEIDFDLLNTEVYSEWKSARKITEPDMKIALEKTGLARKDPGGAIKPTRAAVLLFAEYPTDILDTKCAVRIFQYDGRIENITETPNLIGLPKTITGPVSKQISDTHEYVLNLLRSGIRVPSGFVNKYQLPERAVKEAITNAIIHRDYYLKRDITVKIFEDRVEIESPGLFPYNITPSNIGYVRSEGYRNDLLVKHLREFPSPPNLDQNEGVRAMRSEMRSSDLYPPIFFTYPSVSDAVRVVLLNEKVATEWEKVSHFLKENKYITNEQAREITGVDQRDKMAKILKKWVNNGLLICIIPQSGYVRATRYRLADSNILNNDQ